LLVISICSPSLGQMQRSVEARQMSMKELGRAMKTTTPLVAATTPIDQAAVRSNMAKIVKESTRLQSLFASADAGSTSSTADARIWTNKRDFDRRLVELGSLAKAVGAAPSRDRLTSDFGKLTETCRSCHRIYRKKQSS